MQLTEIFGDVAEMLAKMDPAKIIQLKAPKNMAQRVELLVHKKKSGEISFEESLELERYLALDLLINLTKARAKILLAK